jgi:hypothetical protein
VNAAGVNSFERDIIVTPTWTTMDGTVVRGTQRKAKVTESEEIGGCEATLTYTDGEKEEILWYYKLSAAVGAVSSKTETDVTIDVRKNADLPSHNAYTGTEGYTYTLNGNDKTLNASGIAATLFVCNKTGAANSNLVLNNATIEHTVSNGTKIFTTNVNFNIALNNVTINSTAGSISEQALFAFTSGAAATTLATTIEMDNVHITWNPYNSTAQRAFIDFNYNVDADMSVTNSTFTGTKITNAIYWRHYKTAYVLNFLEIDDNSKVYFDGKIQRSGGAPTITGM